MTIKACGKGLEERLRPRCDEASDRRADALAVTARAPTTSSKPAFQGKNLRVSVGLGQVSDFRVQQYDLLNFRRPFGLIPVEIELVKKI